MEEKVAQRTRELENTRLEIIRRLGRAAEYRDNETGLHILRMSLYSQVLATHLSLGAERAKLIMHAAPMHDVGKIGIPDRILLKQGRLNPEEMQIMRTHTRIGAEMLSGHDSELLGMASRIALTHHEKWDGSGYPEGLAGEEIPLETRIVAVADVFDALTSARPYKKAWSVNEVVALIRGESGTHFDPRVVDSFDAVLPELLELREHYADPTTTDESPLERR